MSTQLANVRMAPRSRGRRIEVAVDAVAEKTERREMRPSIFFIPCGLCDIVVLTFSRFFYEPNVGFAWTTSSKFIPLSLLLLSLPTLLYSPTHIPSQDLFDDDVLPDVSVFERVCGAAAKKNTSASGTSNQLVIAMGNNPPGQNIRPSNSLSRRPAASSSSQASVFPPPPPPPPTSTVTKRPAAQSAAPTPPSVPKSSFLDEFDDIPDVDVSAFVTKPSNPPPPPPPVHLVFVKPLLAYVL